MEVEINVKTIIMLGIIEMTVGANDEPLEGKEIFHQQHFQFLAFC